MKKNIFTLFLLLASSTASFSNPVSVETAKTVAQNFKNSTNMGRQASRNVQNVVTEKFQGENTLHIINFEGGGWVMVSAEGSTVPVLAHSSSGTFCRYEEKPPAFLFLMEDYKEQISHARRMRLVQSAEVAEKWDNLISGGVNSHAKEMPASSVLNTMLYVPGTRLLYDPLRGGRIRWGQDRNNSGGCTPSFNARAGEVGWNHGWIHDCDACNDRVPVGCGPVAMAQIMWYWRWPQTHSNRTYNWDLMWATLHNGETERGYEIARLLRDCANAINITWACGGSFPTSYNTAPVNAFRNNFGYQAARRIARSEWGNTWDDVIRSEINAGRPVFYYGRAGGFSLGKAHFFIVDGYCAINPNMFYINFGWRGNHDHIPFLLGSITPGSHNFSSNQYAVIGISPTLPGSGMDITVSSWPTNAAGLNNGNLLLNTNNANSFDFVARNASGTVVHRSAGLVSNNNAILWNSVPINDVYTVTVRLRNNFGRTLEHTWTINLVPSAIIGTHTICDQTTFRIENLPNHLTINWILPENVTYTRLNNYTIRVNRNTSRPTGPRSISASINFSGLTSSMFFHRYIHVGVPNVNDIGSIFDGSTIHTQGFTDLVTYAGAVATYNNFGIMSAQWQQVSGVSITNLSGSPQTGNCPAQGAEVGLILHSNPGQFGQIRVRLSNQCGWSPSWATLSYLRHNPGGTFPPCRFCGLHPCICEDEEEEPDFLVHPNPVSDVLTIDLTQVETPEAFGARTGTSTGSATARTNEFFNIRLLNAHGVVVRQQRTSAATVQIDVSNLPEGTYYLHIEHNGEIEKHQIIVQRN